MQRLNKIYDRVKQFIVENLRFLLLLAGIYLLFNIELPYIIYTPGGSINLSSRIEVENGYESEGSFEMAYVSVIRGSIPFVLLSFVMPNWDLERKDAVTLEDETISEMIRRDRIYLEQAVNNATLNAYKKAGKDVEIISTINHISFITNEAQTDVLIGDRLLKANGVEINSIEEYRSIVESGNIGDTINLLVLRNNREIEGTIKIFETDEGLRTGIGIITTHELETNPKLNIRRRRSESGPSGGLMMALGIYDALISKDITGGKKIIGTGSITAEGEVNSVGGIRYKIIGAERRNADIFIVPERNYEEANKVKKERDLNIKILKVTTFTDAVEQLKALITT